MRSRIESLSLPDIWSYPKAGLVLSTRTPRPTLWTDTGNLSSLQVSMDTIRRTFELTSPGSEEEFTILKSYVYEGEIGHEYGHSIISVTDTVNKGNMYAIKKKKINSVDVRCSRLCMLEMTRKNMSEQRILSLSRWQNKACVKSSECLVRRFHRTSFT